MTVYGAGETEKDRQLDDACNQWPTEMQPSLVRELFSDILKAAPTEGATDHQDRQPRDEMQAIPWGLWFSIHAGILSVAEENCCPNRRRAARRELGEAQPIVGPALSRGQPLLGLRLPLAPRGGGLGKRNSARGREAEQPAQRPGCERAVGRGPYGTAPATARPTMAMCCPVCETGGVAV